MKKKSILLVIPNLGKGGAQQVFRDQLEFYSKHFNTIGCVFNWDDTFEDDRQSNIISLDVPAGKSGFDKIVSFWKRVAALKKIKQEHNIDFSISHLEGADYVNVLSRLNDKIICWIHGTKAYDENIQGILGTLRKKVLIPAAYRRADKVIAVSEGIGAELNEVFNIPSSKIKTIYNSFVLDDIFTKATQSVSRDIQELFSTRSVLITHCRLSRQKNLFALVDIYITLKKESNSRLMILGDGELRDALLNYCKANNLTVYSVWDATQSFNLNYDVYFLGYERNPYPYLHRASLYLMTSSWEGFPLALCEAMACEVPVVAADCYTGPREIISPGLASNQPITSPVFSPCGILMPLAEKENLSQWTSTIIAVMNNAEQRRQLTSKGKERVLAFDRKNIQLKWLNLINQYHEH
ncbi:glycosyltransferase [Chryseolinea sp. H1M3-3]|uniref:glycosyltransferase n=1 Tax=Chryseolinea sp. H1M3-3 TaxID=3034144 RepID=UPI0023EBCA37|nr:glycosyltransferase [Chryseolinea sp. H1M3-3]